jgi:hypothetical protein
VLILKWGESLVDYRENNNRKKYLLSFEILIFHNYQVVRHDNIDEFNLGTTYPCISDFCYSKICTGVWNTIKSVHNSLLFKGKILWVNLSSTYVGSVSLIFLVFLCLLCFHWFVGDVVPRLKSSMLSCRTTW